MFVLAALMKQVWMTGYIIEHLEQTFQICQKVKRGQFVTKEPWKHTSKDMKKVKGEVPNVVNYNY